MTGDRDCPAPEPAAQYALPDGLADLLALAETLDTLPLAGVEPVLGAPRWQ